jgi:hypothetical protein
MLAYGFDIAVYYDTRSNVNWLSQNGDRTFCPNVNGGVPRETVLGHINSEDSAFVLLQEMGVNRIITYYPFADDFTASFWSNLHGMKILNYSWPGEAFKYLEAQNRFGPC